MGEVGSKYDILATSNVCIFPIWPLDLVSGAGGGVVKLWHPWNTKLAAPVPTIRCSGLKNIAQSDGGGWCTEPCLWLSVLFKYRWVPLYAKNTFQSLPGYSPTNSKFAQSKVFHSVYFICLDWAGCTCNYSCFNLYISIFIFLLFGTVNRNIIVRGFRDWNSWTSVFKKMKFLLCATLLLLAVITADAVSP